MAKPAKDESHPLNPSSEESTGLSQAASQTANAKSDIGSNKSKEDIELEQALEGFKDLAPDRADGFFQPAPGAFILGRLLGRSIIIKQGRKKQRAIYQIKVKTAGAPKTPQNPNGEAYMVSGKGDDSVTLPIQRGITLAMDERKALEILAPYAESNDGVFDVFIRSVEKVDIAGGEQTFWRFEIRTKQLKAPSHPIRPYSARAGSDEEDEIPF
jgi:hypothetical protein